MYFVIDPLSLHSHINYSNVDAGDEENCNLKGKSQVARKNLIFVVNNCLVVFGVKQTDKSDRTIL